MMYSAASDPAGWRGSDPATEDRLRRALSSNEAAALADLAHRLADGPTDAITAVQFTHPGICTLLQDLRLAVMHGMGACIVSGLAVDDLSLGALERIFWGLGTHLGSAAIQSPAGERIARVERRTQNPEQRGSYTDAELRPHTDMHELMGLACVRSAAQGGQTLLVSAATLYQAILQRAPQAIGALEQGYYAGVNSFVGGANPSGDEKIPIFSTTQGKLSCYYNRPFMMSAARARGESLPSELQAAMAIMDVEAVREGLGLELRLNPGDMLFWHNWTCLHARRAFSDDPSDDPSTQRLLLRLWLNVPDGRAVDRRVAARATSMDRDHSNALLRRPAGKEQIA